jgi:integrase
MSHQRGSLRQEGGRWILRIRVDGREERLTIGSAKGDDKLSKRAARTEANVRLQALQAGPRAQGERITLERFAPFFLDKVCSQKKTATRAAYASAFKTHLLPALGKRALTDITERELTELVASLELDGKKPGTVRLVLMVLSHALRKAIANGYAARMIDLKGLALYRKREISTEPRTFTREEVAAILKAAILPWRSLYALLAFTGLRGGEALGLTWSAIDLPGRQITLAQAAYMGRLQSTKTASSAATVSIPQRLLRYLEEHRTYVCALDELVEPVPSALLFPSPRDPLRPYWSSGVRVRQFAPLLKTLGLPPAGLHAFRHTFATELFRLGKPATVVKAMMRHADIKSTLRYTRVTLEDQKNAADSFADAIEPCEEGA